MRTSGAHHRRTHGDCGIRRHGVGQSFAERLRHGSLRKFADGREHILATRDLYAVCAAEVFDDPVELFDDIKLFNGIGKIADKLFGQGIDDAELQHRSAVAEHLAHILITCTGRYDSDSGVGSAFNAVECAFGGKFRDRRGARFDLGVLLLRVSGHHYVFLRILHIRFFRGVRTLAEFDKTLRMRDPCTHTEHYGSVKSLRKFECLAGKKERLR